MLIIYKNKKERIKKVRFDWQFRQERKKFQEKVKQAIISVQSHPEDLKSYLYEWGHVDAFYAGKGNYRRILSYNTKHEKIHNSKEARK